jgi:hypothetical protein
MRIYVNDHPVDLPRGMTVKHALIHSGLLKELEVSKKVYDKWENEVGLDGALDEEMRIYVK